MSKRDFLATDEWHDAEILALLDRAGRLKRGEESGSLAGRVLTMVFFDPSLRTRTSFEVAMAMHGSSNLQPVPYDRMVFDYLSPRTYQAALVDLNLARTPDPDPYPFWHQAEATGGQNYSQWDNRTASEYLEQARVIVDPVARLKLYRNFQVVFSKETPAFSCITQPIRMEWMYVCVVFKLLQCMIPAIASIQSLTGT